jgi:hypothetical protein
MGESLVFFAACGAILAIGIIVKYVLSLIDVATGNTKKKKIDYTALASKTVRRQARYYGKTFRDSFK